MAKKGESMGERFRRLRHEAKLTQEEAAERGGIPLTTLRNWERGKRLPRLDHAVRLARALGVDMNELVGFDEPPAGKAKQRGRR
jgi:transcriptional regulator with XRE-family HTH domain